MNATHAIRCLVLALVCMIGFEALAQIDEFGLDQNEWARTGSVPIDPDVAEARRLLALDQPAAALALLNTWIDTHKYTSHPDLPEAYLLRGDAKNAKNDEYEALYDYEVVIKQFYGSDAFPKAVEREFEIAVRYINGLRRYWLGLFRVQRATSLGEELLIRVQERMPQSQLAEIAALELADHYYKQRDMRMAADMYGIFVENYPQSEHRVYAGLRQIFSNIASFKGPRYDRSGLIESQVLIERFQARYPADAEQAGITVQLQTWIDESAANHLLDTAVWYLKRRDEASARFVLRRVIRNHPGSTAASQAADIMLKRGWLETAPTERSTDTNPETTDDVEQ
ncbi:MAG: outer membrane protein assembly factor BamD [Phycisphaeraceae bacterium]|nr:outer membrane protein assembly factor BamD [Phycisphaeraceae bacterium]MCW5762689.1 outer membrane protein assembly factor BamD [Phycisphaeraceae bacterium]